jgi:hypothetical protein
MLSFHSFRFRLLPRLRGDVQLCILFGHLSSSIRNIYLYHFNLFLISLSSIVSSIHSYSHVHYQIALQGPTLIGTIVAPTSEIRVVVTHIYCPW